MKKILCLLFGLLLSGTTGAATFNIFGPATGILKGSASSPITTAAAWSDVQVLLSGTCNSSVFVRGDGSCVAINLSSNVTGTLPVANGGTNLTAASDDNVMVGNGTTWQSKALTDCDGASSAVTYDVTTNAWGCNTISTISGAALTRTNDTNVTLTLGGSPTTALVNAASITAGWTGTLAASRGGTGVSSLGDITRTNDTNVTLTLGGTPTGSVINSTSFTMGWSGTLAASRGGLGMSTVTDDTIPVANGTTWASTAVPTCTDSGGNHLNYNASTNAFSCGTSSSVSSVSGANPTASVGLTAVNGSAGTFLRSDGAPALSQSISPTWTGAHAFQGTTTGTGTNGIVPGVRATFPAIAFVNSAGGSNAKVWEQVATTTLFSIRSLDDAYTTTKDAIDITKSGNAITDLTFGNTTDNPTYTFSGSGATTFSSGAMSGAGSATWTGQHTFSNKVAVTTTTNNAFALTGGENTIATFAGPNTGVGWQTVWRDTTNSANRGYIGVGTNTATGVAATDFVIAPGISGSLVIGTANGAGIGTRFGPSGHIRTVDGSASTPAYSFESDTDTGPYRDATNSWSVATGGTSHLTVRDGSPSFIDINKGVLRTGDGSASAPVYTFFNDTDTGVYRVGANSFGVTTGGTNRVTFGPGVQVGSPTGGDQGAGTINATGFYLNGTQLDAGSELVGTFTGTLTGVSGTVNCSMKYRKVGNFVTLYIASGSCSGTSNATTMTMTGIPSAIQTGLSVATFSPACIDNGTGLLTGCLASFTASSGTMTLSVAVANATSRKLEFDGSGWASSNSKGLNTNWVIQYQTGT